MITQYHRDFLKREYDYNKEIGYCVYCHHNKAKPNRVACQDCADYRYIRHKAWKRTHKEYLKKYTREYRRTHKEYFRERTKAFLLKHPNYQKE